MVENSDISTAFLLQKAMEDLGFSHEEIIDIFRIISAVLKLSNINFIPTTNMDGTDGCAISNDYGKFCIILVRGFFFFPLLIQYVNNFFTLLTSFLHFYV